MPSHPPKAEKKVQASLEEIFWKRIYRYRWLFQITPHLSWVGVCNSLPMKTLKPGSDIDLFIVTEKGRLFTCRIWITLLTQIFGVRRHGKKIHKRFCLSFFVEEGHEDLLPIAIEEDIYLAQWIQTLQPIAGKWHGYEVFYRKNRTWTESLNGDSIEQREHFVPRNTPLGFVQFLLSLPTRPFESLLKKVQLSRSRKKAAHLSNREGTVISDVMLKFHDNDKRREFRDRWKRHERRLS